MILTIRTCIVRYVYNSGVKTIHRTIRIAEGLYRIVSYDSHTNRTILTTLITIINIMILIDKDLIIMGC